MPDVSLAAWAATLALIAALFAIDLLLSGRRPRAVAFRAAVAWSIFYLAVALLFGVAFGALAGWRFDAELRRLHRREEPVGRQPLRLRDHHGRVRGPGQHQQRVLTFGILAALVLRAIFIALGAALLARRDPSARAHAGSLRHHERDPMGS